MPHCWAVAFLRRRAVAGSMRGKQRGFNASNVVGWRGNPGLVARVKPGVGLGAMAGPGFHPGYEYWNSLSPGWGEGVDP
jgi:hypothetical protein